MYEAFETELAPYLDDKINKNELWHPREICEYLSFNAIYHTLFGQRIDRNQNYAIKSFKIC